MPRLLITLLAVIVSLPLAAQSWTQWGGGPRHTGSMPVIGQTLRTAFANIIYDPFAPLELERGALFVHFQTPLSDGKELYMEVKGGTYTNTWQTQTWSMRKFEWVGSELVERWTAESDWDPVPQGAAGFEPVFHGALANGFVYMPAAGGTVFEVERNTGVVRRRLGQFGQVLDSSIYVTGPISVADDGTLYYNTLKVSTTLNPWQNDHEGSWLVKVTPDGTASRVSYQTLVPNAPAPNAQCTTAFNSQQLPWPPSANAVAPTDVCGSQRPGLNSAPAIGADGTIYTASRTHRNSRWAWVIAVNPNLTPKWSTSLRNRFQDGCNVLLPPNGAPGGCRSGATTGVDPSDNQFGSGAINDDSTASPAVAPDGSIYMGTYTRYNHSQGHMVRLASTGQYLSAYPFGWDVTPAIYEHDGTFSVITKENRYPGVGTYCGSATFCPPYTRVPGDEQGYYITRLTPQLTVEWKYKNEEQLSCERQSDGSIECEDDQQHPYGFEWCVNSVAVDARGVVYINSEDGHLYAINPDGTLRERIFLQLATGAAYTPLSLGSDGKVYTQNAGHLFAVGSNAPRRRAARK
jgi:outer membrane protein assembly factor BamB